MTRLICLAGTILILIAGNSQAGDIRGTTDDGRKVLLRDDGTWEYAAAAKTSRATASGTHEKPSEATTLFKAKGDKFLLWYDPLTWHQKKSADGDKTTFVHKDGDVYAMVLAERFGMTLEALKDLAIRNAQKAATDARVTSEEYRTVNGKKVLCMKMEGTIEGIQFIYYGYYYAGKAGIIQLITYTAQNLLPEYEADMTQFLNGLVINE